MCLAVNATWLRAPDLDNHKSEIKARRVLFLFSFRWLSLKETKEGDLKWSGGLEMELRWSPWEQDTLKLDNANNNPGGDKRDGHALDENMHNCYILDLALKTWLPVNCTTTIYCFICKKGAG